MGVRGGQQTLRGQKTAMGKLCVCQPRKDKEDMGQTIHRQRPSGARLEVTGWCERASRERLGGPRSNVRALVMKPPLPRGGHQPHWLGCPGAIPT